ncbi:hypothetical protein KAR28_04365 [Candidatus Parcubacteria bacterium]|nr:hypothetical protein [Candidatus Parcubacteria bacterium]
MKNFLIIIIATILLSAGLAYADTTTIDQSGVAITGGSITGITDITVADGGTGVSTLTDHGVLIGSGATAITALTVGTNGQILIGSTGADPVFADLTCGDNITCTTGAGTLEIDVDDVFVEKTAYFATTTHQTISDMPALTRPFAFGAISTSTLDKDGKYLIAGATSTVELIRVPYQWTISELGYDVTAGTAGMNLGDGTNWSGFKSVSTTFASSTISSNTTFDQGEALTVDVNLSADNTLLFITGLLTTD